MTKLSQARTPKLQHIFLDDLKTMKTIDHRNIIKLIGLHKQSLAIILEFPTFNFQKYLVGQPNDEKTGIGIEDTTSVSSLSIFLKIVHEKSLAKQFHADIDLTRSVAFDIACGLSYLHHHRIAHRNLNLANITISNTNSPIIAKIGDYSNSKYVSPVSMTSHSNYGYDFLAFQAPETVAKQTFCNTELYRTDVWSFGAILFCLLNPDLPFPYYTEFDTSPTNMRLPDLIRTVYSSKTPPTCSESYAALRKKMPEMSHVYQACMGFVGKYRPDIDNVVRLVFS